MGPGSTEDSSNESFPRRERLKRRVDYQACYRRGRRRHGQLANLHFVANSLGHPRLGITASRKIGNAVVRQRQKRRIREIYRRWSQRSALPPVDLVVHLKPAAGEADFEPLRAEVTRLLSSVLRQQRPGRSPRAADVDR